MVNIAITKKSIDELLREVKLKVDGVTSITTPYNREQIAKAAFTIIGKEFSLNYALKKLYLCEVNAQFNLTNSYPIEPFHLLTYSSNNREMNSFINPTTIKLFIDKANPQTLILQRNRDNGIRQKAEYIFPASNVENTTFQSIIVNETDFVDY